MGQYFNPVIVDPTGRPLAALNPATYGAGPKLSTHTRADSPLMTAVEILLTLDGGARLVWAGDYEDPDDGRANYVQVDAGNLAADFGYHGTRWDLLKGYYRGRREPIEGLLKIIEEL